MTEHHARERADKREPRQWQAIAFITVAALLTASGCQPPRRDAIARDPVGGQPFHFPYVDSKAPLDAPSRFGGVAGAATGAPTIAYPLDGAMHPVNVADIQFHWTRGESANTLFRIRLDDGPNEYDFYTRCVSATCLYRLHPQGWLKIASSHPDGQLTATVAGTDGAGGPVYQSPAIVVRFSPEPVKGGLYYWTDSEGGTTYRLPFGASTATPFIVPVSPTNPMPCSGCHSVSRNGAVISFAASNDGTGALDAYLGTAPTQAPEQATIVPDATKGKKTRFTALNADGSRVLTTTYGWIQVLDTKTGQAVNIGAPETLLPAGKRVTHPEWSPDGKRVAFTLYGYVPTNGGSDISDARPEDGEIVTLELDPATGKATRLRRIVPAGTGDGAFHHFYPSWSPDGQWLVMAAAPRGTSAYAAPTARLRLASAQVDDQVCPGPTCFELTNASQGTTVFSSWPKFSPFSQRTDKQLFFVTFSSRMDYGLQRSNSTAPDGGTAQLWMSAIDLSAVQLGQTVSDPSLPPIWLPFQNVTQTNHLPFWSEIVACSDGGWPYPGCGDSEVCDNGRCRVIGP